MELQPIIDALDFLSSLPGWVWVLAFFLVAVLARDRGKLWKFEVEFSERYGIGEAEIEIKGHRKRGNTIELELRLSKNYQNKAIQVFINSSLVMELKADESRADYCVIKEAYRFGKPIVGSNAELEINNETIFTGDLILKYNKA